MENNPSNDVKPLFHIRADILNLLSLYTFLRFSMHNRYSYLIWVWGDNFNLPPVGFPLITQK